MFGVLYFIQKIYKKEKIKKLKERSVLAKSSKIRKREKNLTEK